MDEDQFYIENHRYLAEAFFVLPLPSGRIAVLTPRRDLFRIVNSWEEAKQCGPLAQPTRTLVWHDAKGKATLEELGL